MDMVLKLKKVDVHYDIVDSPIRENDVVAFLMSVGCYRGHSMSVGRVEKLNPKMIRVRKIGSKITKSVYPHDCVKLDSEAVTMYILKNDT